MEVSSRGCAAAGPGLRRSWGGGALVASGHFEGGLSVPRCWAPWLVADGDCQPRLLTLHVLGPRL